MTKECEERGDFCIILLSLDEEDDQMRIPLEVGAENNKILTCDLFMSHRMHACVVQSFSERYLNKYKINSLLRYLTKAPPTAQQQQSYIDRQARRRDTIILMKRCVVTIEGYRARAAILVHVVVVCPVPSTVRPQSSRYLSCKFYSQVQLRYQYEFLISLETHGHINQPAPQPIISITSQNERRLLYMSYYRDIPIRFYFPFLGPPYTFQLGS